MTLPEKRRLHCLCSGYLQLCRGENVEGNTLLLHVFIYAPDIKRPPVCNTRQHKSKCYVHVHVYSTLYVVILELLWVAFETGTLCVLQILVCFNQLSSIHVLRRG